MHILKEFGDKVKAMSDGSIHYDDIEFQDQEEALEVAYDLEKDGYYALAKSIRDAVKYIRSLSKSTTKKYTSYQESGNWTLEWLDN